MAAQVSYFNRRLLVLMIVLYVVSLALFSYSNWQVETEHVLWMFVVNGLILSLPLILFYGAIYVLVSAWHERRISGQINPRLTSLIHWSPRVAAILIIFFITLFSLDVFEMDASPLELLVAFLMHNLPSIFLILLLVFAWRRPVIGFIAFLLAGIIFLRFVIFGFNLGHFMLFSGPLLLVSALFYADWRWHKLQPPASLEAA